MSSDGHEEPSSPASSSASTLGTSDVCSVLQMLAAQSARQEEQRARQEELQLEQEKIQTTQRLEHELNMAKFQASILQAQTDSARELAEAARIARQREADEAEAVRRLDKEEAERLRLKEANLRMEQMNAMEERQAAALLRKAEDDKRAKVEAASGTSSGKPRNCSPRIFPQPTWPHLRELFTARLSHLRSGQVVFLFCLSGGDYTIGVSRRRWFPPGMWSPLAVNDPLSRGFSECEYSLAK